MNRVLFVDDDPNILQGLRRLLRDMRHEWQMDFATGGPEALALLARAPVDVVVTDMRMPGMDGGELLTEVMNHHPDVVRIVLSGQAEEEAVIRTVGAVHQHLAKPCDAETLKKTVERACALRPLLSDETLKRLVSQMRSLPSLPARYARLLGECQSSRGCLKTVGEIIADDVGMTAKVLHLVNSAFFGVRARVSSPVQAVQLLGLDTMKKLVLRAAVFSPFESTVARSAVAGFWRHSLVTGSFARTIALAEGCDAHVVNDASVAGLLHDAGQLVLAANLPERYREAVALAGAENSSIGAAEAAIFGVTHATVGAYLLALWGLPDVIVEAVRCHHEPGTGTEPTFSPLTAVHVASAFAAELRGAADPRTAAVIDHDYLNRVGLHHRLPTWREHCAATAGETDHHE